MSDAADDAHERIEESAADDTVMIAKRNEGLSSQARYSLRRWLQ